MQPISVPKFFHAAHQDALALDVGVLEKLLRANRAAQSRTKYFQRLEMSSRCLRKKGVLEFFPSFQKIAREISEVVERKMNQRKREKIFWEFASKENKSGACDEEASQLLLKLNNVRRSVEIDIPEAIARLEYAGQAIFPEMARGFFLPLCSIAVAAVARIRVLLQNLGSQILYEWPAWEKALVGAFGQTAQTALVWDNQSFAELQQAFYPSKEAGLTDPNCQLTADYLLCELGFDMPSRDGMTRDQGRTEITASHSDRIRSALSVKGDGDDDSDLGERLTTHSTEESKEFVLDYMEAAVSQVQSNLSRSRTLKVESNSASMLKQVAIEANQANAASQGKLVQASSIDKKYTNLDISEQKKKKKKRKDASNSKSTKKTKPSGDFFDNLFG